MNVTSPMIKMVGALNVLVNLDLILMPLLFSSLFILWIIWTQGWMMLLHLLF